MVLLNVEFGIRGDHGEIDHTNCVWCIIFPSYSYYLCMHILKEYSNTNPQHKLHLVRYISSTLYTLHTSTLELARKRSSPGSHVSQCSFIRVISAAVADKDIFSSTIMNLSGVISGLESHHSRPLQSHRARVRSTRYSRVLWYRPVRPIPVDPR